MRVAILATAVCMCAWTNASRADDAVARFDYVLNCAGCHGMDAAGSATVPSLTNTGELLATSAGRAYIAGVPGVAQAPLSDARLAALINWLLAEIGNAGEFDAFTAAEVSRLRAEPLREPRRARERLAGR